MGNPVGKTNLSSFVAASCLLFSVVGAPPRIARAECPPLDSFPGVQSLLDSCQNWVCDFSYNPQNGYLPEDDPTAPWEAYYGRGARAEITPDGKLRVTGPGYQPPELDVFYRRYESSMEAPDNWLYVLQMRFNANWLIRVVPSPEYYWYVGMGAVDSDRVAALGFAFHDGFAGQYEMFAVVDGIPPIAPIDSTYKAAWDPWTETTYTIIVHRGRNMYVLVDGQLAITVPYDVLPAASPTEAPGVFGFTSGDSQVDYSYVQACVCEPGKAILYGKQVAVSKQLAPLVGPEEKIIVENLRIEPEYFDPRLEPAQLHLDLQVLELPGVPSGQFDFKTNVVWEIETDEPVRRVFREIPLDQTGTHPIDLAWHGEDDMGENAPNGVYTSRVEVELVRTKIGTDKIKVFDEVTSLWMPGPIRISQPIMTLLKFHEGCAPDLEIDRIFWIGAAHASGHKIEEDGSCGFLCWQYQAHVCEADAWYPEHDSCAVKGWVHWDMDPSNLTSWEGWYSHDGADWYPVEENGSYFLLDPFPPFERRWAYWLFQDTTFQYDGIAVYNYHVLRWRFRQESGGICWGNCTYEIIVNFYQGPT